MLSLLGVRWQSVLTSYEEHIGRQLSLQVSNFEHSVVVNDGR